MTSEEIKFLKEAALFLEAPSFLVKMTNYIGKPIRFGGKVLPEKVKKNILKYTQVSLFKGLEWSINSLGEKSLERNKLSTKLNLHAHTAAAGTFGAIGGFLGFVSLPVELPLTTLVMLRVIAKMASDAGEDLNDPRVRLECLQVLSMGSQKSSDDDDLDSAYFIQRLAFANLTDQASKYLAKHTTNEVLAAIEKKTAPELIRLISKVATKFKVVVSEKILLESVPVVGAIGGAGINLVFTNYFGRIGFYHFGVKRLERKYGCKKVKELYKEEARKRK